MAAADNRPGDPGHEGSVPEASPRRLRAESQIDFELDFFARILERDPLYASVLRSHASNLAARGLYARALQADRRLVRLMPDRPIPWYNLACSYALLGMVDAALAALQRSVDLGYHHVRNLCRDSDLNAVRDDPRFIKILRKAAQKA